MAGILPVSKHENNIYFFGFKKDTISFYKKSDFFIHTAGEPDPLPTVILEAISCETPVIATIAV